MKVSEWMNKNISELIYGIDTMCRILGTPEEPPKDTPKGFRRRKGERRESDSNWED